MRSACFLLTLIILRLSHGQSVPTFSLRSVSGDQVTKMSIVKLGTTFELERQSANMATKKISLKKSDIDYLSQLVKATILESVPSFCPRSYIMVEMNYEGTKKKVMKCVDRNPKSRNDLVHIANLLNLRIEI